MLSLQPFVPEEACCSKELKCPWRNILDKHQNQQHINFYFKKQSVNAIINKQKNTQLTSMFPRLLQQLHEYHRSTI